MNDNHQSFDFFRTLAEHAGHLNAINSPAESPRVFYEILSGALVWTDETNDETSIKAIWALRPVVAYRTGLILNERRDEFKALWDHALSLFPGWVGFRPERRQPTPELQAIYRRGSVRLRKCLRDLERHTDAEPKNDAESDPTRDRHGT
jgi:hypothetical protein